MLTNTFLRHELQSITMIWTMSKKSQWCCRISGGHCKLSVQVDLIPGPEIYLAAAYWSLTAISTIGFGDITPVTNAERAVMLLVEILGVLFFGILLGSITSLLQVCLVLCSSVCPVLR